MSIYVAGVQEDPGKPRGEGALMQNLERFLALNRKDILRPVQESGRGGVIERAAGRLARSNPDGDAGGWISVGTNCPPSPDGLADVRGPGPGSSWSFFCFETRLLRFLFSDLIRA